MCCSGQADRTWGLPRSCTEQWEIWCRSSLFWLALSSWGGRQICGELQELLGRKDKPHVVSSQGEGKGQSATGRAGGRRRVKGAGTWGWELEEQLTFISNSQYVAPKCKGWHFGYCWGKLSPRLSTTPFLCIAENHGKITNQSSDSNKKSG